MFQKFGFLWKILLIFPFCYVSIAHAEEQGNPKNNGEGTDYCEVKRYPESLERNLIQYIQNAMKAGISSNEIIENVLNNYPSFKDLFEKQQNEGSSDDSIIGMFQLGFGMRFLAEGGCLDAQTFLAAIANLAGNYQEALKWYRPAAEKGDASSQSELGGMYFDGHGVQQDYKEAVKWYRLAADQGYDKAQYNLGVMYSNGHGIPQNYKEAVKLYRLAADQGYTSAQNNLGVMYSLGEGVPEDYVQAHMWYNLAAAGGDEQSAEVRKLISELMTSEQIAEAQKLAREWMEKHQDDNQ